ncbi:alpha/beta-hydrolase [Desarmillaria tabescens]|uniref:Carboxylic ester hydrolase n=1 Tax=Armillaria tabescens TaxID=1929756 RepID=A0AA39NP43_ARMTA|nr:alpha/beta-hydrolase [Desarmillaria tabescens]KAK0469130.1 alpha/beta-hydrolase [Desarmillaria tabescens]
MFFVGSSALFALLCFSPLLTRGQSNATVVLDYGTFNGATNETSGIVSYLGVRFADAPIGDLRWHAPVSPPTTHLGEVDAASFGPVCIATSQSSSTVDFNRSSEDCLFGNVYVPIGASTSAPLPVLVYWHGGGYQGGNSRSYTPEWLMQSSTEPFIFVTFQYRLGQFGFLGGSLLAADGVINAGLLDQRAALRWVQRYIGEFGGNSSHVTIWGQSAGAGSTMFQVMANGGDNEDLFHAAMGDSASVNYMPLYNESYPEELFSQFASLAYVTPSITRCFSFVFCSGCEGLGNDTLTCLRAASSNTLAVAGNTTIKQRTSTLYSFSPIIDGTFIREGPVEAFTNGQFAQIPLFYGSNTNEGANWSARLTNAAANTSTPNATETTVYNFLQGQYGNFTLESFNKALELYPIEDYNNSLVLQGQQMYGEMRFICTAVLIAGSAADADLDVYHYHYDNPHLGDYHHYELQAMFPDEEPDTTPDDNDEALFEIMREYWTSFATSDVPQAASGPDWEIASSSDGSPRMLLQPGNVQLENVTDALNERCEFWYSIAEELRI